MLCPEYQVLYCVELLFCLTTINVLKHWDVGYKYKWDKCSQFITPHAIMINYLNNNKR